MTRLIPSIIALFVSLGIECAAQYPGSMYYPLVDGNDVTFIFKADQAENVQLYGDFLPGVNEYNLGGHVDMTRNSDDLWEYTAHDLAPDFYFYYFEVDGVRALDPSNLKLVCNYSEYYNSFLVEGPGSENLGYVGKGTVETLWYDSPEYGGRRRLNVYLPEAWEAGKALPALYMIPGGGDDEDTWIDMGRLPQIMDHLIDSGEAREMVVVMVNAMPNQLAAPHVMDPIPGAKSHFELMGTPYGASGGEFCNDLVHNIIPLVEARYGVRSDRDGRAVCGVSMGGVYEMYLLEHYPDLFSGIAFMGSGIMNVSSETAADSQLLPLKKSGYKLFWVGAGKLDMALRSAQNLMGALDRCGMPYVYYDSEDGHNWRSWRRNLQHLLPLLFR